MPKGIKVQCFSSVVIFKLQIPPPQQGISNQNNNVLTRYIVGNITKRSQNIVSTILNKRPLHNLKILSSDANKKLARSKHASEVKPRCMF
jgi:hypothetical protein